MIVETELAYSLFVTILLFSSRCRPLSPTNLPLPLPPYLHPFTCSFPLLFYGHTLTYKCPSMSSDNSQSQYTCTIKSPNTNHDTEREIVRFGQEDWIIIGVLIA